MKHKSSFSSMFLLELIIGILFMSLISSVCVGFFVKGHLYSRDSLRLDRAVNTAVSVAELVRSAEDPAALSELLHRVYPTAAFTGVLNGSSEDGGEMTLPLDGTLSGFNLTCHLSCADDMMSAHIEIGNDPDCIYSLDAVRCISEVVS